MICPKCGNECDDNQMFCNACGTKLKNFVPTDQEEIVVPDRTRPTSNIHGKNQEQRLLIPEIKARMIMF